MSADADTPIVTEEERLVTRPPTSPLIERWLESGAGDLALERIEKMVGILSTMRRAAIVQTYPEDWVIHTTTDHDGTITKQVGYLQDTGADRAGKVFGVNIGRPTIERDDDPTSDAYTYRLVAAAASRATGETIDTVIGARWSGDTFFTRGLRDGEKINPADVMKAAYANLHGRAVRSLCGLSAVPLGELAACGLDIKRCQYVGYAKGSRGGESAGAKTGGADPTVAFGKGAGKTATELEDKDLAWYIKAYSENVADEGKKRFKAANQQVLDSLTAEQARRKKVAEHAEETGTEGLPAGTRGQKLTDLRTRLMDVTKKDALLLSATIRMLSKEDGEVLSLSDLTDAQLDRIARLDNKTLEAAVAAVKESK